MTLHNLPTIRRETSAPSIISRDDDRTLSIAFNGIREEFGDVTIYRDRMPVGTHRERLDARLAELNDGLAPADPPAIRKELAILFGSMAHRGAGTLDAKLMANVYIDDLADLPMWAISQSCRAFRRGEAGEGHWAPTQAEIRRYAKVLTRRYDDEKLRIEKILNARVIDPPKVLGGEQ